MPRHESVADVGPGVVATTARCTRQNRQVSQHLLVMPLSDEVRSWLREEGRGEVPDESGSMPSTSLIEDILARADWPYRRQGVGSSWQVFFEQRDGLWPPIQTLGMSENSYGRRLGPLYGPFHVAQEVSEHCGPQVMIYADGMTSIVVCPTTTYEEVHLALYDVPAPPDGSDRTWT